MQLRQLFPNILAEVTGSILLRCRFGDIEMRPNQRNHEGVENIVDELGQIVVTP